MTDRKLREIGWNFDNSYARLPNTFYSILEPTPVPLPKLIKLNSSLASTLGLCAEELQSPQGIAVCAGNIIPEGTITLAQAYAGHQFGHFTKLGDGRAILIGEQITPLGERFDLQLKGSGITPYSRRGDGRAALGPMLREYIISEAMYALGIPTTRSLAVVTTGESVIREKVEIGAILTRVAASHLRVGTFQYISNWGKVGELKELADYTLKRHFPYIEENENKYLMLLKEVINRQASLIAKWQLVGFIHGVMNTDNMTISGETIDYGPCAFMDTYDPKTVFSSIDRYGRYAYRNQPPIAEWNLTRFAETLLPLLQDREEKAIELAKDALMEFNHLFHINWLKGMRAKLGLINEEIEDEAIIRRLLEIMEKYGADYTNTFRELTIDHLEESVLYDTPEFTEWNKQWKARLERQQEPISLSYQVMKKNNPSIIPRNHRVEEALAAAVNEGDYTVMEQLLNVLSRPFEYSQEQIEYAKPPEPTTCPYRTFCGT